MFPYSITVIIVVVIIICSLWYLSSLGVCSSVVGAPGSEFQCVLFISLFPSLLFCDMICFAVFMLVLFTVFPRSVIFNVLSVKKTR